MSKYMYMCINTYVRIYKDMNGYIEREGDMYRERGRARDKQRVRDTNIYM